MAARVGPGGRRRRRAGRAIAPRPATATALPAGLEVLAQARGGGAVGARARGAAAATAAAAAGALAAELARSVRRAQTLRAAAAVGTHLIEHFRLEGMDLRWKRPKRARARLRVSDLRRVRKA